jgi:two-component system sensor histidine kinase DctS
VFFTKILRVFSLLTAFLCGLVCMGWTFQLPMLIQVDPSLAPMSFSTAFGLVLAALSLADYLLFHPRRLPYFACCLLIWTGLFLFPIDFAANFFHRMSTGASLCLFLFAAALILVRTGKNYLMIIAGCAACFVGWVGVIGLLGHFIDTDLEMNWGAYSRMSPPTAVAVIFMGFALPVAIHLKNKRDRRFYAVAFYVAVLFTSLTILMEQTFVRLEVQKMRREVDFKSDAVAWEIKSAIMAQYQGFRRMATRMEHGTYADRDDWASDAAGYFRDFKGIQSIHWTDKDYTLRWLYPVKGNEPVLGKDIKMDPVRFAFMGESRIRGDIFSAPWELLGGGRGFVLTLPLHKGSQYAGSLGLSYKFENLFPAILSLQGYALEIFDGETQIYSFGSPDKNASLRWGAHKKIQLLNREWNLILIPNVATLRSQSSSIPSMVLIFGLIISTTICLAAYFYMSTRDAEKQGRDFLKWQTAVMSGSPLLILSGDRHMKFKSLNKTGERLLGYSEAEVLGKFIPEVLHPHARQPGYEDFLAKILRGEEAWGEWAYQSRDGRNFYGSATVSPLRDDKGEISGFVSMIEDITEKRNQQEKMIASARLASLGEMAAGIAHEINNPLTIIGAHAATVRRDMKTGQEGSVKKLETIERTVQRIAKIIRSLRSLSRETPSEQKSKISIRNLIDETLSFCAERFRSADIELEVSIDENIFVLGQEHQLSQVILNLLNNAYDATVDAVVKKVRVTAGLKEGWVEICVIDTGTGVSPELREKIMQPFFTTKEVGQGLGLGLSISQGIIASHGGQLSLDPNSAQTKFVIRLPG